MLLGDFNARTRSEPGWTPDPDSVEPVLPPRRAADPELNAPGRLLLELCQGAALAILNGRAGHDTGGFTCQLAGQDGRSTVDYALIPAGLFSAVTAFEIVGPHDAPHPTVDPSTTDSDHSMLTLALQLPIIEETDRPGPPRFDSRKTGHYIEAVRLAITTSNLYAVLEESDDLAAAVDLLQQTIVDTAVAVFGRPTARRGAPRAPRAPWYDTELHDARSAMRRAERRDDPAEFRPLRRTYKLLVCAKRNAYKLAEGERLLALAKSDPRAFSKTLAPPTLRARLAVKYDALYAYFQALLVTLLAAPQPPAPPPPPPADSDTASSGPDPAPNTDSEASEGPPPPPPDPWGTARSLPPETATPLAEPFTIEEVLNALRLLRANRSPDLHGIRAEYLKTAAHPLLPLLTKLANRLLKESFPATLAHATLVPLLKKGDPTDPGNYRGIAIVSLLSKLYATLLSVRLTAACESAGVRARGQAGFRPQHSTTGHIWLLQQAVRRRGHGRLYACFVDFAKAFDSVPRDLLWLRLTAVGVPPELIRAIESYYSNVSFSVRHPDAPTPAPSFPSTAGVKQGCPLSPILFGLFIDYIEEFLTKDPKTQRFFALQSGYHLLLYADDLVLLANDPWDLQDLIDGLDAFCRLAQMSVNLGKTQVVVFRPKNQRSALPVPAQRTTPDLLTRNIVQRSMTAATFARRYEEFTAFLFRGQPLAVVESYRYLGFEFHATLTPEQHGVPRIVTAARRASFLLASRLRRIGLQHLPTIWQLFDTYVGSKLLYACEAWLPDLAHPAAWMDHKFEQLHRDFLRLTLALPRSVPTTALMWESGRYPLVYNGLNRLIAFYNRARAQPATGLLTRELARAAEEPARTPHTLAWFLTELRLPPTLPAELPVADLLDTWRTAFHAEIQASLVDAARGRTYRYGLWQSPFAFLPSLDTLAPGLSLQEKRTIARLRLGCHRLPIETGGWCFPPVPRDARFCPHCPAAVGTVSHFLFDCPAANPLRDAYPTLPFAARDPLAMLAPTVIRPFASFVRRALPLCEPAPAVDPGPAAPD